MLYGANSKKSKALQEPADLAVAVAARISEQARSEGRLVAPLAIARRDSALASDGPPLRHITELVGAFRDKSVGQRYRGPGWVDDNGLAWVILLTTNVAWVRAVRRIGQLGLITWRWNNAPSCPVSLTAAVAGSHKLSSPVPRWFGASQDPVTHAIRRNGRFMVMVAHPHGMQSGWLLAQYDAISPSGLSALERQFSLIPTPGLPGSQREKRYEGPFTSRPDRERGNEIPLWAEPIGDFWSTLGYSGPWAADLERVDLLQAEWGMRLLRAREHAAGTIELLRNRFALDGEAPFFTEDGSPSSRITTPGFEGLRKAATAYPGWARLAAAVAGPSPDAQTAYEAALACLRDANDCFGLLSVALAELPEVEDEHLLPAIKLFLECALLAPEITSEGLAKPWIANSPGGLVVKSTPLNVASDREEIRTYWRQGLELHDVIDGGLWAGGGDFPFPLAELSEGMAGTIVEGGTEAAEAQIASLCE